VSSSTRRVGPCRWRMDLRVAWLPAYRFLSRQRVKRARHSTATGRRGTRKGIKRASDHPIHQPGKHVESLGNVLKHQPLMDHVPRAGRDGLRYEVQCADFELRAAVPPGPAGVEVHGQDPPGGTHLICHPSGNRAATGTHFQAACPRLQPQSRQVAAGDGIEHGLQSGEAIGRLEFGVRQEVRRLVVTHPRVLARCRRLRSARRGRRLPREGHGRWP